MIFLNLCPTNTQKGESFETFPFLFRDSPGLTLWLAWNYHVSVGKCNRPRRKAFFAIPFHCGLWGHFYLKIKGLTLTFFVVKLSLILSRFLKLIFIKYASFDCLLDKGTKNDLKDKIRTLLYLHSFKPYPTWSYRLFFLLYYSAKNLMPKVFFNTNMISIFAVNYTIQQFNTISKSPCWKVPT